MIPVLNQTSSTWQSPRLRSTAPRKPALPHPNADRRHRAPRRARTVRSRRADSVRSFEIDRVSADEVVLIDETWQAVSISVSRFSCPLKEGTALMVPVDAEGTPSWVGAEVQEVKLECGYR